MSFPITPEMVKAAYDKTGLRPARQIWFDDNDEHNVCACGLDVLIFDRHGVEAARDVQVMEDDNDLNPFILVSKLLEIDAGDAKAFSVGFDGTRTAEGLNGEAWNAGRMAAELSGLPAMKFPEEYWPINEAIQP